jgi:ferrous iron transport protein B
MTYIGADMMFEFAGVDALRTLLIDREGWTLLTAICLMLFSVLHNPCTTTIWTMHRETGSVKWTMLGAVLPLVIALGVTFAVAQAVRVLT